MDVDHRQHRRTDHGIAAAAQQACTWEPELDVCKRVAPHSKQIRGAGRFEGDHRYRRCNAPRPLKCLKAKSGLEMLDECCS